MDFSESPEHAALRSAVAAIAGSYGPTYYQEHARSRQPCEELWTALGEAGFIGVNIATEHGGGGGGLAELVIVCEEIAGQGVPLLLLVVSAAISAEVIGAYGSDDQQQRWLPRLADGTGKVVFAVTEPDAGTNTHRLTTRAERTSDGWVMNGTKYYISGYDDADACLVVARTGTGDDGRAQMSLFVVPTDTPGITANDLPVDVMMPDRQFTLFFDDVHLDDDALVGEAGAGFQQVFHGLNPERVTAAALCIGMARHALRQASEYARTREVFDVPIGAHQGVAHPLAKAAIEVETAALMVHRAAWQHDHGEPAGEAANMAKYAAAEAACDAADRAVQAHGGHGISTEYGVAGLLVAARAGRIAPVSREMVLNFVGTHSLGLPKSY